MVGKRGISTIIATVLIVLITVAAVTILWAAVSPLIDQEIGQSYLSSLEVDRGGYTAYDSDGDGKISVRVTRGSDDVPMTGFKIVVTDENGNTYEQVENEVLDKNSAKVYRYNLDPSFGTPTSVLVVPIFEVNGDSVEGTPTQQEVSFVNKDGEITATETFGSGVGGGGPTCSDGIQNGDETGVDCGGSSCAACHYLLPYSSNVMAYWTFEDLSMSSDNRYGGSSITCTINGNVPLASGKIGTAASISGAGFPNDYIRCDNAFSSGLSEFTISVWLQSNALVTNGQVDYFMGGNGGPRGWRSGLNNGRPAMWMGFTPTQSNWVSSTQTFASTTEFYNIVYVWNGANDRFDVYLNGVGPTSASVEYFDQFAISNSYLLIGIPFLSSVNVEDRFAGKIDELVFLDVALDDTEVAALYNNVN